MRCMRCIRVASPSEFFVIPSRRIMTRTAFAFRARMRTKESSPRNVASRLVRRRPWGFFVTSSRRSKRLIDMLQTNPFWGIANSERDRKSVVKGKSVTLRVDLGGRRIIKKNPNQTRQYAIYTESEKGNQYYNLTQSHELV